MPSTQNNKQPLGIREIQIPNTTNTYPKNIIRNQKYSAITFPFVVFINQFRYFFNIYFFLICISQCFPVYSVSPLISNIGPWALVLLLTLLKEGMDDYKRYKRDKEANSEIYSTVVMGVGSVGVGDTSVGDISNVSNNISNTSISNIRDISNTSISNIRDISNTNTNISNTSISNVIDIPLTNTPSSSLKVGDIIFLKKNQRIPADCLLIKTSDPSGSCFIRTDQLDGETDWKLRTSPHITQSLTYKEILLTNLKIFADKPHKDIYSFIGKLSVGYSVGGVGVGGGSSGEGGVGGVGSNRDSDSGDSNRDSDSDKDNNKYNTYTTNTHNNTPYTNNTHTTPHTHTTHTLYTTTTPLNLENMLWMNTVLATGYALCVVIYTGKETRAQLNTSKPKNKYGLIESELNTYSIFLCSVSISIACIFTFLRGVTTRSDATLIRFIVILSNVIPISLKVSIDWARYVYSRVIMTDKSIEGCIVRTSNLPEELGRIGYLLSDKTGTLTKNEMEMKKVHLGTVCYTEEDEEDIRSIISKVIEGGSGRGEGGSSIRDRCEGGSRDSNKVLDGRDSNKVLDSKDSIKVLDGIKVLDSKDGKINTNTPNTNIPNTNIPHTNTHTPITPTTTTNISSNIGKKKDLYTRVFELLRALSICHNVTPSEGGYQASSPDEIAIVKWTEKTGIKLINRTRNSMELLDVNGCIHRVKILHIFPFTSETKRMGIIVEYSGVGGSGSGVGGRGVGGSGVGGSDKDKGYISSDKDSNKGYSGKDSSKGYINNTPSIDTNPNTNHTNPNTNHHTNNHTNHPNTNNPTIVMYLKGADTVMRTRVKYNDWLDEEVDNMAREGLRTLVIAMKYLTVEEYKEFNSLYELASLSVNDRNKEMNSVLDSFQNNMTLLGLTGVEDKLQDNVRVSIESLRNAGIKVWMLTGDKIETACSIAVSSKLFRRSDVYCVVEGLKTREEGYETMCMLTGSVGIMGGDVGGVGMGGGGMDGGVSNRDGGRDSNYRGVSNKDSNYRGVSNSSNKQHTFSNKDSKQHPFSNTTNKQHPLSNTTNKQHPFNTNNPHNNPHNNNITPYDAIVIDGTSLQVMLDNFATEFIRISCNLSAVVCCRVSPTQKGVIAKVLRSMNKGRVCCIGDGGNDVSMITESDVGVGIVGKEGNQASLAADFSILRFCDILPLILWHGRNCLLGTGRLSHFIIHRGTIISVMQAIFCSLFLFSPINLYQGKILVGYVTLYTFFPVFCIIVSYDVKRRTVMEYPELYYELNRRKVLSIKSFAIWNVISFYQGSIIMLLSFYFFEHELFSIVTITFSCLIVNEILMVGLSVRMSRLMVYAMGLSVFFYFLSFFILKDELRMPVGVFKFLGSVLVISMCAIVFSLVQKAWSRYFAPPMHTKLEVY